MKLITFSLWGNNPKYVMGAIRNAEIAERLMPDWTCRFYIGGHEYSPLHLYLCQKPNVQYVEMPEGMEGWKGMFARFLPASEDDVDVFLSRDCDSRITQREVDAVNEWLKSPQLIHVMRDHPYHSVPMLGGMWGAKKYAIDNIGKLINDWTKEDRWQTDQEFLTRIIWPTHRHKVLAHDNWNRFPGCFNKTFPTLRVDNEFVGAIIGEHEERLHPEHHILVENT